MELAKNPSQGRVKSPGLCYNPSFQGPWWYGPLFFLWLHFCWINWQACHKSESCLGQLESQDLTGKICGLKKWAWSTANIGARRLMCVCVFLCFYLKSLVSLYVRCVTSEIVVSKLRKFFFACVPSCSASSLSKCYLAIRRLHISLCNIMSFLEPEGEWQIQSPKPSLAFWSSQTCLREINRRHLFSNASLQSAGLSHCCH